MSDSEGPAGTSGPSGASEPSEPEAVIGAGYPGTGFRSTRGGGATARFAPEGAILLRGLVSQVAELVGEDAEGREPADPLDPLEGMLRLSDNAQLPDDPVLARLLPDAYRDDPEAAGEFRRYTEGSLRASKAAAAQTVLDTLPERGGRVRLSADDAQAWLRAINDVRLALGVRLEVTEDWEAMLDQLREGDPRAAGLWIYDWLTILQDTLVQALS